MADQEFKILITSTADNTGFNQAAAGAGELTKAQAGVIEVTEKDIKAATADKEETGKLELSKRELRETLRQLGPQFSALGELASLAFNPFTLAVGGLLLGLREIDAMAQKVTENLTGIQAPDIDLDKLKDSTTGWNDYAAAVAKANDATSGSKAIFDSAIAGLRAQLEITKELNKENKNKALADLEAHKGSMSPEDYTASKKAINDSYAGADKAAEGKESAAELARKYEEQTNFQNAAKKDQAELDKLKLPKDDKTVQAQIDAQRAEAEAARAEAKKRGENVSKIQDLNDANAHGETPVSALADYATTYGSMPVDEAEKTERQKQLDAEQRAKDLEANAAAREEELKKKQRITKDRDENLGKAAGLQGELPGDATANNTKQVIDTLNIHGGRTNQALGDLATQIGLSEQQKLAIVTRILNHSLTAQAAFAGLEQRLAALEAQGGNTAFNRQ
jgi:hypothetical protein